MTFDDFFIALAVEVAADPQAKPYLTFNGCIRFLSDLYDHRDVCPIAYLARRKSGREFYDTSTWIHARYLLGLSIDSGHLLISAADNRDGYRMTRQRMLEACGLAPAPTEAPARVRPAPIEQVVEATEEVRL